MSSFKRRWKRKLERENNRYERRRKNRCGVSGKPVPKPSATGQHKVRKGKVYHSEFFLRENYAAYKGRDGSETVEEAVERRIDHLKYSMREDRGYIYEVHRNKHGIRLIIYAPANKKAV